MSIRTYSLGPMDNNTYLIIDEATSNAAIVDPSFDSEQLLEPISQEGLTIRYVLNTHAHFDHVIGNRFYVEKTGALLALHRADLDILRRLPEQGRMFGFEVESSPEPTLFLDPGTPLMLGATRIDIRFTPGHSLGGVTFLVENAALAGDCLFAGSVGRWDLPGASYETLMDSIEKQLLTLPDETDVLPGHGPKTTIGSERSSNTYLRQLSDTMGIKAI